MKNKVLQILILLAVCFTANAQKDSMHVEKRLDLLNQQYRELKQNYEATQNKLQEFKSRDNSLQRGINGLLLRSESLSSQIDSLNVLLNENSIAITNLNMQLDEQKEELSREILETRETLNQNVSELDKLLSKNTFYWIIAVLAVCMLSIIAFILLRKKVTDNQSSINQSLLNIRMEGDQEVMRLDEKLVDIFNKQLEVLKSNPVSNSSEDLKDLALKVADRLVVMEQNLSRMDEGTKGLKQLKKGIENIKANFSSNGFEIVDLLGKPFDERDKRMEPVIFKSDENLNSDERIISRIIKPLIYFNHKLIQNAQVEVSQGK
ncbi:MAG: hypothetical protein U5L09_04695 [Bacteroidales bacterium]|nr:hypothetical protein [Bacteroidales bacterium]